MLFLPCSDFFVDVTLLSTKVHLTQGTELTIYALYRAVIFWVILKVAYKAEEEACGCAGMHPGL
jgi:hypothetical protein